MASKNPQNLCPVPGCQRNRSLDSGYGVCRVHHDLFEGITYYLTQARKEMEAETKKGVRPGEKVTEGGLILLPGTKR